MTILGVDVSKWNGNWNAEKAKQAGATFVFVKSSQSTYTDPQFLANWQKAKDAGLLRGAYHYLDYTKPAIDQANYMADLLATDPGELPPVIDYEQRISDNNPTTALGYLRSFLNRLVERTELFDDAKIKVPMIYTGWGFWGEYGEVTNKEYWLRFPLWVAHYTTSSSPLLPTIWPMWNFWQFTGKGPGEVYGSESLSIDMNRFNGTLNELLEFIGMQYPVSDFSTQYTSLEERIQAIEDAVASSPQNTTALSTLSQRVTTVEQKVTTQGQTLTTTKTDLSQRIASLEQKIGVTTPTTPSTNPTTPSTSTAVYAVTTINALNVRTGPGVSYPSIGGLSLGQRVKVIKRQNGWSQLESPAGWCSDVYLSFEQNGSSTSTTTTPSTSNELYGVCNTSGLNVRGGPGVTYPIVGALTYGQRVKIVTQKNGWAQLQLPSGWCNQSYLSLTS
jgi:GH25 family lysozyme M1 (1,4-beta-N-acetylmuramidase)/uncharacterized protein YraI